MFVVFCFANQSIIVVLVAKFILVYLSMQHTIKLLEH